MRKNAANRGHNYYNELGISSAATLEEIKEAYRSLAKVYHPDINPTEDARLKFANIQKAYNTLSDSDLRLKYDMNRGILQLESDNDFISSTKKLREEIKFRPETSNSEVFNKESVKESPGLFQLIKSIFSKESEEASEVKPSRPRKATKDLMPQRERIYNFSVSEVEAITGTKRTFVGLIGGKETRREINIPPVRMSPTKLKLRLPKPDGKTGIDEVKIQINIITNNNFKREGSDVHLKVPMLEEELDLFLSFTIATAVGFETIPLSRKNIKMPYIISAGGLWDSERAMHGDIFVTVNPVEENGNKDLETEIKKEREDLLFSLSPIKSKLKTENQPEA